MFLRISLITLISSLFVINFSFADFRGEIDKCYESQGDIQKCEEKVHKKYTVSKDTACRYKDGVYKLPIETKRPKKQAITTEFYKYQNKLYYAIFVDYLTGGSECGDGMEYYFYSYNCKTKKSLNSNAKIPNCGVKIEQASKNKILLDRQLYDGSSNPVYLILDINNMLISTIDIVKFKGFNTYKQYIKGKLELLFNTTKEKKMSGGYPTKIAGGTFSEYRKETEQRFPDNCYDEYFEIKDIDKNLVGSLVYWVGVFDGIGGSKIDFFNKTITINK